MGWNCGNLWAGASGGGNWLFPLIHLGTSLLFWGAIIAGGFYLVKTFTNNQPGANNNKPGNNPSALEILKLRYAKGEISESDFERMKQNL